MKLEKKISSIASFLLVISMLLTLIPTGVYATEPEEITVYLSLSLDGDYITSEITNEKMVRVPITLSYFDLADYNLEKYYRYETAESGGEYINDTLVTQPTVLHLYIKALEEYYLGRKYTSADTDALEPSGEPTSFYMLNFWGHSQNLMYFVNHEYPLMNTGWGATADYVLLEDGMTLDVAMFTSYEFYNSGYFSYFSNGDEITVTQGDTVEFEVMGASTNSWGAQGGPVSLGSDLISVYSGSDFNSLTEQYASDNGKYSITFDSAGTYYVVSRDINYGSTEFACIAPGVVKVNVEPPVAVGEYEVTVYAGPSSADISFFTCAGFDDNGKDIPGEKLNVTDLGIDTDTSYHTYTMSLDKGTYSFRAADADGNSLGGMTFDVPAASEVDNVESKSTEIYLRQVNVYTTTKIDDVYASEAQYTAEVIDGDGRLALSGKAYTDTSGRTVYPHFLCANGNAELYTVKLIPGDEVNKTYNLGTNVMLNYALSKGTTATSKSGTLPTLINAVISAPSGSRVQVFNQLRNFYTEEVEYSSVEEADGIASYTYRLPKNNGNHTYRVSMDGKITKAGYLKLTSEDTAKTDISFVENEDPKVRCEYDTSTTIGSRLEDSILLNINSQNYLRMNTGDSFKARAYRAWQIINSDTANIMIEPDFEYKVISGDSITLEQNGQNAEIKAVRDGISIVEVTYDAIEIGGNTSYTGIYGAIDPMRKGLFVVNVGGNTDTAIEMSEWDSDFDTVYFTGDSGTYNFAVSSGEALSVKCNYAVVEVNSDGTYTLPINQGNNIVTVTAGDTTEYVIIKGKKLTVNIDNATTPGELIKQGDTVNISFEGLHMPMPKFSGIYNPGFGNTIKMVYGTDNGGTVQSKGCQYNFINNHTLSMTVYDKGTVNLSGGSIQLTSMGFEPGSHRGLTDTGIGANFNAVSVSAEFSVLPEISFEVEKNNDLSYMDTARDNYCNLSNVNILCGTSTYQKSFNISLTTEAKASEKNAKATFTSINSAYPFTVSATPVNDGVTMEFRYWELGDSEKKKVALYSGETTDIENTFTGTKPIYMEIAVTPENPVFGGEKVYSYVVYKTTSGFERPVLKNLTITDAEGNDFAAPYGVFYSGNGSGISYTETDYYCYIPENTDSVNLSVARLIGTADVTVGEETQSVGTSEITFSGVAVSGPETIIPVTLSDGAVYSVKLIKTGGIMTRDIVYDEEKAVVSFVNTEEADISLYAASYSDNSLDKVVSLQKNVPAGDNSVYLDLSVFENVDDVRLFVWDKSLKPIFAKTTIDLE